MVHFSKSYQDHTDTKPKVPLYLLGLPSRELPSRKIPSSGPIVKLEIGCLGERRKEKGSAQRRRRHKHGGGYIGVLRMGIIRRKSGMIGVICVSLLNLRGKSL